MDLPTIAAVLGVAWISSVVVILTLCKAASRADAASESAVEGAESAQVPDRRLPAGLF